MGANCRLLSMVTVVPQKDTMHLNNTYVQNTKWILRKCCYKWVIEFSQLISIESTESVAFVKYYF